MGRKIRFQLALGLAITLLGVAAQAQSAGEAVYKTKCLNCHGANGLAETAMGKALKVKPATDPAVKKMTEAQMIDAVRNGMGKMQPYKNSLSEAQIKDSTDFFRTFCK
jgi:mono/diheme cytochrome c family protein